ncbi:hypothetical protein XPA_008474 [Xanthoria parietina]
MACRNINPGRRLAGMIRREVKDTVLILSRHPAATTYGDPNHGNSGPGWVGHGDGTMRKGSEVQQMEVHFTWEAVRLPMNLTTSRSDQHSRVLVWWKHQPRTNTSVPRSGEEAEKSLFQPNHGGILILLLRPAFPPGSNGCCVR